MLPYAVCRLYIMHNVMIRQHNIYYVMSRLCIVPYIKSRLYSIL